MQHWAELVQKAVLWTGFCTHCHMSAVTILGISPPTWLAASTQIFLLIFVLTVCRVLHVPSLECCPSCPRSRRAGAVPTVYEASAHRAVQVATYQSSGLPRRQARLVKCTYHDVLSRYATVLGWFLKIMQTQHTFKQVYNALPGNWFSWWSFSSTTLDLKVLEVYNELIIFSVSLICVHSSSEWQFWSYPHALASTIYSRFHGRSDLYVRTGLNIFLCLHACRLHYSLAKKATARYSGTNFYKTHNACNVRTFARPAEAFSSRACRPPPHQHWSPGSWHCRVFSHAKWERGNGTRDVAVSCP